MLKENIRPCFEEHKSLEETAKYINLALTSLLSPTEYIAEEKNKIEVHNLTDLLKVLEKLPEKLNQMVLKTIDEN